MSQAALFPALPAGFAAGFAYQPDFLSVDEERSLLEHFRSLPLTSAQYKEFRAKRRVVSYGERYDYDRNVLEPAAPIPEFLHPVRERIAAWAGRSARDFAHALVAEYAVGVRLGWHRDVPEFDLVVGLSLLSACRMRFRRYPPGVREKSIALELAPRSVYRLEGDARWRWQHCVPPVPALRYSLTFRTRCAAARSPAAS